MKKLLRLTVLACVSSLGAPLALAAGDVNEVGAFLVFPDVSIDSLPSAGGAVETLISVTNISVTDYRIHFSYFNGTETDTTYCYECDFSAPLDSRSTQTFSLSAAPGGARFRPLDNSFEIVCPYERGFVVVRLEDLAGNTVSDNVIYGDQVVFDYGNGRSHSTRAIPIKGLTNDGDHEFEFNDIEYGRMPRIVATDFIAPNLDSGTLGEFDAYLSLYTLGFDRQTPPVTSCSVTGLDAAGTPFSASIVFGCWTRIELEQIDPDFAYPNLGASDEHGWLQLNCDVDGAAGGVHGMISQFEPTGTIWGGGAVIGHPAAWGRVLAQSVTTGDALVLKTEAPGGPAAPPRMQRAGRSK